LECLRKFPGKFSAVATLDPASPQAPSQLAGLVKEGIEGIRLHAGARSPGDDPLSLWRQAEALDIPVSCQGGLSDFGKDDFAAIFPELPRLKIIIEHLGRGGDDSSPSREAYRKVLALSRYPNAYLKVPGLGEFCRRPMPFVQPFPFGDIPPLIEMAVEAFGANRLMWGSDFPPSASREGYRNALRWPMERVKFADQADRDWVFGGTAATIWRLGKAAENR
jgi:L-fuconolactonase